MGKSDNNTPLVDPGGRPLPPSRPPSGWRKIREACDELIPEKFRALFKQIPQSLRWFFALLLFVVLPFGAQTHETWSQWLVVQKVSSWIRQPLLPKARHFAIAIAQLENDTDDALRALMIDGLHGVSSIALLNIDRFPAVQGAANVQETERKGPSAGGGLAAQKWCGYTHLGPCVTGSRKAGADDYYAELAKNSVDVARRQLQQAEKKRE